LVSYHLSSNFITFDLLKTCLKPGLHLQHEQVCDKLATKFQTFPARLSRHLLYPI